MLGVRISVDGKECLVIGISMLLLGDTPALKAMCGLSTSISATCWVRMPCRTCQVLVEDLPRSITNNFYVPIRELKTYEDFYKYNNYVTGSPMVGWLQEMMRQYGIRKISEFIRLTQLMSPKKLDYFCPE